MQCLLFLAGLSAEREVATQGGTYLLGNKKRNHQEGGENASGQQEGILSIFKPLENDHENLLLEKPIMVLLLVYCGH